VYHRLTESEPGLPSLLFINAQNKQTIKDIAGPLREFGIPSAAIVDIDVLKDGGATWTGWMDAVRIPEALQAGLGAQRAAIKTKLEATGQDMKRDGGVSLLTGQDKAAAEALFSMLDGYGLFTVRGGELECWLKGLGVAGKKTDWTVAMMERLGDDPSSSEYVRPAEGDVWEFMRRIVDWVSNARRLGT
jgi:hypothetical protein